MGFRDYIESRREAKRLSYDGEEQRLREMIAEMDPFDERYDQLQTKLKNTLTMRDVSKESKRRIAKSDRGGILMKILGVGGAIAGGIMIGKYERDGMTWTGEKRSFVDSLSRTFGNMFMK